MKENKDFTMNELKLSKEAQTALFQMIHNSENCGPKDIAMAIGDSHNMVCNYANQNMPNHLPNIRKLEAMMMYTRNPAILKVWAHQLGFALVPVDCDNSKHHELSIFEAMMMHNIKCGKANKVVLDAYEDGVVTAQEYEEIHQIANNLIELIKAVDSAAYKHMQKYLSALDKEKA